MEIIWSRRIYLQAFCVVGALLSGGGHLLRILPGLAERQWVEDILTSVVWRERQFIDGYEKSLAEN